MAHKMQVEFRSHFSGEKKSLMGWEIWYVDLAHQVQLCFHTEHKCEKEENELSYIQC
jgi:hypothetical protein